MSDFRKKGKLLVAMIPFRDLPIQPASVRFRHCYQSCKRCQRGFTAKVLSVEMQKHPDLQGVKIIREALKGLEKSLFGIEIDSLAAQQGVEALLDGIQKLSSVRDTHKLPLEAIPRVKMLLRGVQTQLILGAWPHSILSWNSPLHEALELLRRDFGNLQENLNAQRSRGEVEKIWGGDLRMPKTRMRG